MYSTSFSLLAAQYVFGDVYGITMVDINGNPVKSQLLTYTNYNAITNAQTNVTSTSRNTIVNNPVSAAAGIAWELILLITGTYIFNILLLFGIPSLFIAGLVALYFMLVMRAVIGYIRGI